MPARRPLIVSRWRKESYVRTSTLESGDHTSASPALTFLPPFLPPRAACCLASQSRHSTIHTCHLPALLAAAVHAMKKNRAGTRLGTRRQETNANRGRQIKLGLRSGVLPYACAICSVVKITINSGSEMSTLF